MVHIYDCMDCGPMITATQPDDFEWPHIWIEEPFDTTERT